MKSWTVLALLIAICAVLVSVGYSEETEDDFVKPPPGNEENEDEIPDSFADTENEDDENDPYAGVAESNTLAETEGALESVKDTPLNDDDEPEMFKRAPWQRRSRRFSKIRTRKILDKACKFARYDPKYEAPAPDV